jgi:Endosomal/lysosomal potassium channel TMEM175
MSHSGKRHSSSSSAGRPGHSGSAESPAGFRDSHAADAGGGELTPAQHFPSEHRSGLQPEKFFRWRAGEITRLEAFCDVVFGFALTLLVVSLEVPRTYAELMAAMRGFLPFAVCFAQLVMIWRAHYKFSRRYGLEDPYTMLLNVVLLFLVLFYVYPLKFVFTLLFSQLTGADVGGNFGWREGSVLMRIYAGGFAAVFLLFVLMYAHAYKLRRELGLNPVEVLETRVAIQENGILGAVGVISFFLALKNPGWAGWFFFVIGPVLGIHGTIFGKRTRMLAEKR